MVTRYPSPHPQLLDSNPIELYEVSSGQIMGSLHQAQSSSTNNQNMNGLLALGPPQSYQNINPSASVHDQENLNPFEDFFSEEEIRLRSHEMLENEDMKQFLRLFSMGGGGAGGGSATYFPEDGYDFPSFLNTPMQGYDDEDGGRSGRSVVGWLKIKAAMRWGFFIRRKAAERRAQIVDLDDDDEE